MLGWKPSGPGLFHEIEQGWYKRQLDAGAYARQARGYAAVGRDGLCAAAEPREKPF